MITIIAKNKIKLGMAEGFKNAAKPLIEASQKEAGCIAYDLYEDISNPNILTFVEKWQNQEAIDTHNSSAHFTQIVPQLGAFSDGMEINLYKKV